jgi:hypothetical protein
MFFLPELLQCRLVENVLQGGVLVPGHGHPVSRGVLQGRRHCVQQDVPGGAAGRLGQAARQQDVRTAHHDTCIGKSLLLIRIRIRNFDLKSLMPSMEA